MNLLLPSTVLALALTSPAETPSQPVREIIVYRIQADQLDAFAGIKDQMIQESLTLEGLLSSTTAAVLGDDGAFADTMVWTSAAAAEAAKAAFEKLPTAPRFLGMMDGPPLSHYLLEYQAESNVPVVAGGDR